MLRLLLLALLTAVSAVLPAQDLSVISYNIRYNNPDDGNNAWPNRKERVVELLMQEDADIVGMQEVLYEQLTYLAEQLDAYGHVAVGRDDGWQGGEASPVFWKKDKFELLATNTFWLSETPQVVGSKSWDAAITRIVTWVRLRHRSSGTILYVFNTHFDHKGEQARVESARLLIEKMLEIAGQNPVIVTGDLNSRPGSEPYEILTKNLADAGAISGKNTQPTAPGFSIKSNKSSVIDYVLVNSYFALRGYAVLLNNNGNFFPSDHLPVKAILRLL